MALHGLTERRLIAERLERAEMRLRDQDLRRHADGHYVWLTRKTKALHSSTVGG